MKQPPPITLTAEEEAALEALEDGWTKGHDA